MIAIPPKFFGSCVKWSHILKTLGWSLLIFVNHDSISVCRIVGLTLRSPCKLSLSVHCFVALLAIPLNVLHDWMILDDPRRKTLSPYWPSLCGVFSVFHSLTPCPLFRRPVTVPASSYVKLLQDGLSRYQKYPRPPGTASVALLPRFLHHVSPVFPARWFLIIEFRGSPRYVASVLLPWVKNMTY